MDTIQAGISLGPWNASINSPALTADASAIMNGGYYNVTTGGSQSITGTPVAFAVGDRVAKNGNLWYRIPYNDLALQKVTPLLDVIGVDNDKQVRIEDQYGWPGLIFDENGLATFNLQLLNQLSDLAFKAITATSINGITITNDFPDRFLVQDEYGWIGSVLLSDGTKLESTPLITTLINLVATAITTGSLAVTGNLTATSINGITITNDFPDRFIVQDEYGWIGSVFMPDGTVLQSIGSSATGSSSRLYGHFADILHLMTYGQSLSVALGLVQAANSHIPTYHKGPNMYAFDADATRYDSLDASTAGDPAMDMARMFKQQLATDGFVVNDTNQLCDLLASASGQPGLAIASLVKGTASYSRFLESVTNGLRLANALNKTYNLPGFFWLQAEQDYFFGHVAL
ncbi:hypothetical protein GCM10028808_53800 [Spirosoma migulaei]